MAWWNQRTESRPCSEADAPAILNVFLAAVRENASVQYSAELIAAWPRQDERVIQWTPRGSRSIPTWPPLGAEVAGFADAGDDGYIHMMFDAP